MTEEIKSPNLKYAAKLLRRLTDTSAADPIAADLARLSGPLYEVTFAVMGEGRDNDKRRSRLKAEITARGLDVLQTEIDLADPRADLSAFEKSAGGWESFDLADFQDEDLPPTQFLVKPHITMPGVAVFFSRPKKLKTLIIIDLCMCVAGGYNWLLSAPSANDGFEVKQGRVLWLDLENGKITMKRRIRAFSAALGMKAQPGQFQVISLPMPWPDLSKPENVSALIERIQEKGDVSLLVIDHLAMVFGGIDENSPLASQIMAALRLISETCNLSIITIHHANKFQKDGATLADQLRGSGAILAGVDSAFFIERDDIDKSQVKIISAASRNSDVHSVSARFTFEQDSNLDLTAARFYQIPWKDAHAMARDLILKSLESGNELNHTQLRNILKDAKIGGVTDSVARKTIDAMEGMGELFMRSGSHQSKIYSIPGVNDDNE